MTVYVVSLEWNFPPSEVTGDSGIVGVFATQALADAAAVKERREFEQNGDKVFGFTMAEGRYCGICGELRALNTDPDVQGCSCDEGEAVCCDQCGADLNERGSCDVDHDEWDIDVHVTEHQVVDDRAMMCGDDQPQDALDPDSPVYRCTLTAGHDGDHVDSIHPMWPSWKQVARG